MWPIATDGVAWSVGQSVCHDRKLCKNGLTDRHAVWDVDLGGTKEPCIRWSPDLPREWAIMRAKRDRPRTCAVDKLKATQQEAASVQRGYRLGCTRWYAHWRHLANTTEASVCGGDAA